MKFSTVTVYVKNIRILLSAYCAPCLINNKLIFPVYYGSGFREKFGPPGYFS